MEQRIRFAGLAESGQFEVKELCASFGISRKTGHKWLARYRAEGSKGLADRSRAPKCVANRTDAEVELLRQRHVKVQRHDGWDDLGSVLAPTRATKLSEAAGKMLENLRRAAKNRPARRKTLVNHAKQHVGQEAGLAAQEKLVAELEKAGILAIDDKGKVTYRL